MQGNAELCEVDSESLISEAEWNLISQQRTLLPMTIHIRPLGETYLGRTVRDTVEQRPIRLCFSPSLVKFKSLRPTSGGWAKFGSLGGQSILLPLKWGPAWTPVHTAQYDWEELVKGEDRFVPMN
jgi:hypothetical protein